MHGWGVSQLSASNNYAHKLRRVNLIHHLSGNTQNSKPFLPRFNLLTRYDFQIWRNLRKLLQYNIFEYLYFWYQIESKSKKCLFWAISFFPRMFSKVVCCLSRQMDLKGKLKMKPFPWQSHDYRHNSEKEGNKVILMINQ